MSEQTFRKTGEPCIKCDRCGGFGLVYENDSIQSSYKCGKCGGLGFIPVNMDAIYEQYFNSISETNDFHEFVNEIERKVILWALRRCDGNQIKAAAQLKLPRTTLQSKMKTLGIEA